MTFLKAALLCVDLAAEAVEAETFHQYHLTGAQEILGAYESGFYKRAAYEIVKRPPKQSESDKQQAIADTNAIEQERCLRELTGG